MNDIQIDEPSWSELAERKRRVCRRQMFIASKALIALVVGIAVCLLTRLLIEKLSNG